MNPWDVVIIVVLSAAVLTAVIVLIRNRINGKCCGSCEACGRNCSHREKPKKRETANYEERTEK